MNDREAPPDVVAVARVLARLVHRFADREAILSRAGHDEASWSAVEARALEALRATGDLPEARTFLAAFVAARLELVAPEAASESSAAPTVARFDDVTLPGYKRLPAAQPTPIFDATTATSDDPLAVTLSSASTRDSGKTPRR